MPALAENETRGAALYRPVPYQDRRSGQRLSEFIRHRTRYLIPPF